MGSGGAGGGEWDQVVLVVAVGSGGQWGQVVLVVVSRSGEVYMYYQVTERTCLKYYSQM